MNKANTVFVCSYYHLPQVILCVEGENIAHEVLVEYQYPNHTNSSIDFPDNIPDLIYFSKYYDAI